MTKVVDPNEQLDDENFVDIDSMETNVKQEETSNDALDALEQDLQDDTPEKFRGKSVNDIIHAYTELEKAYSRQGNEYGELRKATDSFLQQKLHEGPTKKESQIDVDSLLETPEDAINSVVDPRISALEQEIKSLKSKGPLDALTAKHPDWQDKMWTPEFQNWLHASPVRSRMFSQASEEYDYATGMALLDEFDVIAGVATEQAKETREAKRKEDLKATTVEKGATGEKSKPYFRKVDLARLYRTDRDRYYAMQDEIELAYREGRVK